MKSVLISIKPKWCDLIASGKKTIEVRKTKPRLGTPFKVYMYCTKPKNYFSLGGGMYACSDSLFKLTNGTIQCGDGFEQWAEGTEITALHGKVIGEFVCDYILGHCESSNADIAEQQGFVKREEIFEYSQGKEVFGWHISDLIIYDKPKELSEFIKPCQYGDESDVSCFLCDKSGYAPDMHIDCFNTITRPPQSWCYVEDIT